MKSTIAVKQSKQNIVNSCIAKNRPHQTSSRIILTVDLWGASQAELRDKSGNKEAAEDKDSCSKPNLSPIGIVSQGRKKQMV